MTRIQSLFVTLTAAVVVIWAAAGPAHAVRCLKMLTRNGTVVYCGGGYVDLHGNVYTKKKAALSPPPAPHQGPAQINHPVMVNAASHAGGGRH